MPYFLGIDFGTSSIKGIIIDEAKNICAEKSNPLPAPLRIDTHNGIGVEQNPNIWWQGLLALLEQLQRDVPLDQIEALAIDGTSGSVLLTDPNGVPLTNALMYNDNRSQAQQKTIADCFSSLSQPKQSLGNISGLSRALWLIEQHFENDFFTQKNSPSSVQAPFKILNQSDWILGKLSGQFKHSDINNVLKLGFDPIKKEWPDWMQALNIPAKSFPLVYLPGELIGNMDSSRINLGFSSSLKLAAGTTDSTAAIMASGANKPGQAITSLGSTLVMKVISEKPIWDQASGIYSQPYFNHWLVGGSSNAGGAVLSHYFSKSQLLELSQEIDPLHSSLLDYYPLVSPGERFPIVDPKLKPRLEPRPKRDSLFLQGMLEGLAKIEATAYQKLTKLGAPEPQEILSMGGGSCNLTWNIIRERVIGLPVSVPSVNQAAYGTALLARSSFL